MAGQSRFISRDGHYKLGQQDRPLHADVRFGSKVDKPSRAKIHLCPLWSNSGQTRARHSAKTTFEFWNGEWHLRGSARRAGCDPETRIPQKQTFFLYGARNVRFVPEAVTVGQYREPGAISSLI
jgi:hypothetical protein